jgi:hypothetical protein
MAAVPPKMARVAIPPPAAAVNTVAVAAAKPKKPRSAGQHRERNRDRHRPGYMAAYMRCRRAAASQARDLSV